MLDIRPLEALAAVIETGGFDKASAKLFVTQSAVSQRIRQLEDQIGQIVLKRTTPPSATATGQLLLKHFLQIKQLEDDLMDKISMEKKEGFQSLAIGLNADSLETWFLPLMKSFIDKHTVTLDLYIDDQEQTQKLLKEGKVAGCITSKEISIQGCISHFIGTMQYQMLATNKFIDQYFSQGFNKSAVQTAPAVIFNRKDELHDKALLNLFKKPVHGYPIHYVPASNKFLEAILSGFGYGMVPYLQGMPFVETGELVDFFPASAIPVKLYWHCWNINSTLLKKLSQHLIHQTELF